MCRRQKAAVGSLKGHWEQDSELRLEGSCAAQAQASSARTRSATLGGQKLKLKLQVLLLQQLVLLFLQLLQKMFQLESGECLEVVLHVGLLGQSILDILDLARNLLDRLRDACAGDAPMFIDRLGAESQILPVAPLISAMPALSTGASCLSRWCQQELGSLQE